MSVLTLLYASILIALSFQNLEEKTLQSAASDWNDNTLRRWFFGHLRVSKFLRKYIIALKSGRASVIFREAVFFFSQKIADDPFWSATNFPKSVTPGE